jgi:ArsR family metal-binding transcriptional regulator
MKFIRITDNGEDVLTNPKNISEIRRNGNNITVLYTDNKVGTLSFKTIKEAKEYMNSIENKQEIVIYKYTESMTVFGIFVVTIITAILYKN